MSEYKQFETHYSFKNTKRSERKFMRLKTKDRWNIKNNNKNGKIIR